ncbi:hypothetical protein [Erythrobacter ani]|uniref:Peptidase inhibitor I78 family protein n=1 Tax=Erythrobacter ani TaxID=2827235 RepID=A0ABS6SQ69_9SPHN|nr:hypothetical protein [Erythrobacter ani]MBV7267196.1 hypothetical protein [Erythrobacter ani]
MKTTGYCGLLAGVPLALSACAQVEDDGPSTDVPPSVSVPADTPPPIPPSPPLAERQRGDLPPCPGINPDIRRPPGSNCLGITPDQCGADRAQDFVGRRGTDNLRREISQLAVGGYRWIPYLTPVTDDLNPVRMNVLLSEGGLIDRIDCY